MKLRLLTADEAREYQDIIDGYHPSAQTVYNFARSRFAVIVGPTGAGKDTIRNALSKRADIFINILSSTSRPPRPGEQDGIEYHFQPLEYFEQGLDERRFLQAKVVYNQQLSCLDITEIEKLNDAQIGVSILVVETERQLRSLNPDLKTLFIVPPSLDALKQRMQQGRELAADELERRTAAARFELESALKSPQYYCIVNDDLSQATELAYEFLANDHRDTAADESARGVITEILEQLNRGA